ncbi:MAG: DUF1971 domain-containing protein [Alphaproteobacteria bacterium]|nr:DUF1971 domain-containing protein [Alphaproteobacteria bacterium]
MKKLPATVRAYSRSPTFDETSIPDALRKNHQTKAGVWGVINVLSGELRYRVVETETETTLSPELPGIIEPKSLHAVEPLGPVSFYVEFWR